MHAFNIAFLLLAVSAAAPALAAPLSACTPATAIIATDIATRDATLNEADVQLLRTLLTLRSENDDTPLTKNDINALRVQFGRQSQGYSPDDPAGATSQRR